MAITSNSKADAFNDYFKSIFTTENLSSMPIMPDSPHPNMQDIDITASHVHALFSKINLQKVSGPDDIPAWVLQILYLPNAFLLLIIKRFL